MSGKKNAGLAAGVFCCLISSSTAQAGGAELIKELLDQGRVHEAYDLAITYLSGEEGDPEFDFQYGVAAIDSGNISEGVFALERVAFSDPENPLVRLELARGYYLLKQYGRSRQLFEQIMALNPPKNVQLRIERYLGLIDQQQALPATKMKSFVEIWRGYDSNINSAPESQTDLITLTNDALGRGDQFSRVHLRGQIDHQYAIDRKLDFSMDGDFRSYDVETDQDYALINLNGGHTWIGDGERYRLGAQILKVIRDGEEYQDQLGVNASWNHPLSQRSELRMRVGISQLYYAGTEWKDAVQYSTAATYLNAPDKSYKPVWFTAVFAGQVEPDTPGILANAEVGRTYWGGNAGVQFQTGDDLTLTPSLTYQSSRYKGDDWLYGKRRQDDFTMLNLNLEWALQESWTVLGNISAIYADSNIELNQYDRRQALLGVRYKFK